MVDVSVIKVSTLTKNEYETWDSYVKNQPETPAYLLTAWKQTIENAYGHTGYYLQAKIQSELVGVLPLVHLQKPWGRGELCSLPFCDIGGPIVNNEQIKERLIQAAEELQQKLNLGTQEIRQSFSAEQAKTFTEEMLAEKKVRMILDLPPTADELMNSFKSKLRSQVRKAEKNGLTVELGRTPEFIEQFYTVFSINMRDLGSPVHAKSWFHEIQKHFGNNMIVAVVKYGNTIAGAGIVLFNNNVASIPWASTNAKLNALAPNMLLYWSLLANAIEHGCSQFDFGRSTYGEGTFRFKKQWGAKPIPLNWQNLPLSEDTTITGSSSGKLRNLVTTAWQKLPLPVANSIGPRLRRYISL